MTDSIIESVIQPIDPNQLCRVTFANGVITFVPTDPQNRDYVAIQKWVASGGVMTSA